MIFSRGIGSRLGLATLCVAVVAIVLGGAGLLIWLDRISTLHAAHSSAQRLSQLLSEQTERTVQAVDLMLVGIMESLAASRGLPEHDPALQHRLEDLLSASPFVRALYIIGPDGFIIQDTDYPDTPRVSLADRDYFRAQTEGDAGLYIGAPARSRSLGFWFVGMSRRIPSPDGRFAGIVAAAVEPAYFERFYTRLLLSGTDSIALFRRDGTLIARYPNVQSAIGTSYASYEPFNSRLSALPVGSLESAGFFGDTVRILAYRALDGLPLVVTVGLDKETVLAPWRQRALVASAAACGIALLGVASLLLLIQRYRHRVGLEQRLAQAQKLDAVGRMAAGIVHDFRNILGAMASGARLIRSRTCDGALTPILDEMDAAVERGADLASKLLTVSRQQDLALEVVDINQLLRALEPLLKIAAGSGIRLRLKLAPEVWPCRLDRAQFDGALLNLILNARDAMASGGEVRVATANAARPAGIGGAIRAHGDYARITVTDTGQGMTSQVTQRALEPFYTTKGEAGTGLGLSQVYGFVHQVGGDMRIKSQPGVGTTVDLFFPRYVPARARGADHAKAAHPTPERLDQHGELRAEEPSARHAPSPAPLH